MLRYYTKKYLLVVSIIYIYTSQNPNLTHGSVFQQALNFIKYSGISYEIPEYLFYYKSHSGFLYKIVYLAINLKLWKQVHIL